MAHLLVNVDVPDLERAILFYTEAFELRLGRRLGPDFAELLGAELAIYLLLKSPGTPPFSRAQTTRTFERHWTPVHFDVVVTDIDSALLRAENAGATRESPIQDHPYGRLVLLSDPFGHGFCLLQFQGRGYDEIAT
jgi:predicted enzyme related to lactoylglutathione lyase